MRLTDASGRMESLEYWTRGGKQGYQRQHYTPFTSHVTFSNMRQLRAQLQAQLCLISHASHQSDYNSNLNQPKIVVNPSYKAEEGLFRAEEERHNSDSDMRFRSNGSEDNQELSKSHADASCKIKQKPRDNEGLYTTPAFRGIVYLRS